MTNKKEMSNPYVGHFCLESRGGYFLRAPETLPLVAGVAGPGLSGPARSAGVCLPYMLLRTLNTRPQVLL